MGVSGPGSVSASGTALNIGKRGSTRSSNSASCSSGENGRNGVPSNGSVGRPGSTGNGRCPGNPAAPLTSNLRPSSPRPVSAMALVAGQANSNSHPSRNAARSRSGVSWAQAGRRARRWCCPVDPSMRRAAATLIVSGLARSTTPVPLVPTARTRNRIRSSKCRTRTGSAADALCSRLATVRQIIQSSCRPTGGAIRTTRLGAQPPRHQLLGLRVEHRVPAGGGQEDQPGTGTCGRMGHPGQPVEPGAGRVHQARSGRDAGPHRRRPPAAAESGRRVRRRRNRRRDAGFRCGWAATPVTAWPAATSCRAVARPSKLVTPINRIRTPEHLHDL